MTAQLPPLPPAVLSAPPRHAKAATVSTRLGLVAGLKLTEPVRLYAYSVLAAVLLALALVGSITGEWSAALTGIAAAVLGVPGVEAARASVYSPRSHIQSLLEARAAMTAAHRIDTAAGPW